MIIDGNQRVGNAKVYETALELALSKRIESLKEQLSAMTAERDNLWRARKEWIRDETRMNRLINAQESQIKEMTTERDGLKESRDTALRMLTREQDARIRDFAPLCDKIAALEKEVDLQCKSVKNWKRVVEEVEKEREEWRRKYQDAPIVKCLIDAEAAVALKDRQLALARAALRAIHNNSSDGYIDPTLTDSSEKVEDYAAYALAAITALEKTAGTEGGV